MRTSLELLGGHMSHPAGPSRSSASRERAVLELAEAVLGVREEHPLRVAVDGVGAAGKTVLADEISLALRDSGRQVIRAGVDGFHNPPDVRYRRGPGSPEGYYRDSFDHAAIRRCLADPLGPDGDRRYRTAVYDFRTESPVDCPPLTAERDAILLFDGVFLLRSELCSSWDCSIFVETSFDVTLERALTRDVELFGGKDAVRGRYESRYIPGETMYLEEERPESRADVVLVNDDPWHPVVRWRGAPCAPFRRAILRDKERQ